MEKKETLAEEIARKAKHSLDQARQLEKERADQRVDEVKKQDTKIAKKSSAENTSTRSTTTSDHANVATDTAPFIACAAYVGSKKGFVFKKGDNGMGYYIDNGGKPVKNPAAFSSKPTSLDTLDDININAPTLDCSKKVVDRKQKQAASAQCVEPIEWKSFEYQFRQTKEGIAVIVDVKDIIEESVIIHFDEKSFDVSFASAAVNNTRVEMKTVDFGLSFDCLKELDVKGCKFDVATHNMVIVLQKKVAEFWVSEGGGDGDKLKTGIISSRSYAGVYTSAVSSGNCVSSNDDGAGGGSGDSSSGDVVVEDAAALASVIDSTLLLSQMKFGSVGLLDLD